jgi:hypothetical protein
MFDKIGKSFNHHIVAQYSPKCTQLVPTKQLEHHRMTNLTQCNNQKNLDDMVP